MYKNWKANNAKNNNNNQGGECQKRWNSDFNSFVAHSLVESRDQNWNYPFGITLYNTVKSKNKMTSCKIAVKNYANLYVTTIECGKNIEYWILYMRTLKFVENFAILTHFLHILSCVSSNE